MSESITMIKKNIEKDYMVHFLRITKNIELATVK